MADTPLMRTTLTAKAVAVRVLLFIGGALLTTVSWGQPLGEILATQVALQYKNLAAQSGSPKIKPGEAMAYTIHFSNRGVRSISGNVQLSVHSQGASCADKTWDPGSRLPNSFSPIFPLSIPPGSQQSFDVSYDIPPDICGNGFVRVFVNYKDGDSQRTTVLQDPTGFHVQ